MDDLNPPVYPANHFDLAKNEHGLLLRDYIAVEVMKSFMTEVGLMMDNFPKECYEIADRMLEARRK